MKVYLTCYVWGDGYTTKCFDPVKQEVLSGSHTMNAQERTLFVRSNARLLLATVGAQRFGFVRQIDADAKDENGRKCVINLALAGNGAEVDGIIAMAVGRYQEFAQAVRGMIYYEENEFKLDWEKFRALAGRAVQKDRSRNSAKPVTLLCAEPSIGYFIKNCGMGWKESDIERQIDIRVFSERGQEMGGGAGSGALHTGSEAFQERGLEMRLYIYCATPSKGYMLKEIDSRTGNVLHEEKEAREMIAGELLAMIDNSGCRMALFRVGGKECFVAKEVKADTVNQYGQRTTVCVAAESTGNEKMVRQMAVRALMDYDAFRTKLTDCIKVSASTVGFTVDGEKLRQFMASVQEPMCFASADPCHVQWDTLMREKSRQYTFMVMDTSLDYFCRSTGLNVSGQQVFYICPEKALGASPRELATAFRAGAAQIRTETPIAEGADMKASGTGSAASKASGTELFHSKAGLGLAREPIQDGEAKIVMEDAVNLLENPVFKAVLGVFAFVLAVLLLGFMIYKILHKA